MEKSALPSHFFWGVHRSTTYKPRTNWSDLACCLCALLTNALWDEPPVWGVLVWGGEQLLRGGWMGGFGRRGGEDKSSNVGGGSRAERHTHPARSRRITTESTWTELRLCKPSPFLVAPTMHQNMHDATRIAQFLYHIFISLHNVIES